MKVIKPQSLSLLTRPYEFRRRMHCGIAVLAMVPLGDKRALISESAMWPMVAEVLGSDGYLDEAIPKENGEFLVAGNAWAPQGERKPMSRIRVRVGQLEKTLNVVGDRFLDGERVSQPEPFESIALSWSNAFGGEMFSANPLGKGFEPHKDEAGVKRYVLPNIEYPDDMMGLPGQRTRPAGLGAVDSSWKTRRSLAGTYDEKWMKTDYPGFAADIDWSFFNIASIDQQLNGAFRGEEEFLLQGLHPEHGSIHGRLPGFTGRCFIRRVDSTSLVELKCSLTTVWFFPDLLHAVLIFHASTEVEQPDASDLTEIMIAADNIDGPRPSSHYLDVFARRMDDDKGAFEMLRDQDLIPEGLERGDAVNAQEAFSDAPESIRSGQLRRRMKAERAEGDRSLESRMQEIGVTVPPAEPEPDFGFDPENTGSIRLEDLPEIMDRMEAYSLEKRADLEKLQEDGGKRLEKAIAELKAEFPDAEIKPPADGVGPPKFRAETKENEIRKTLDDMENEGFDVSDIRAGLLNSEMLELLRFAERSSIHAYRMSANYREPAPRASNGGNLAKMLLRAIEKSESVDARDYTGADLSGANLAGADLSGIFLESADLTNANLSGANLEHAVLAHADLSNARLDGARLNGANLGRARLKALSARGADFTDAILTEATLAEAVLEQACLVNADLRDAVLEGATLAGVEFPDALFMDQSLRQLNLSNAKLTDAVFINADLDHSDLSGASMAGCTLVHCSGRNAVFEKACLNNLRMVEECDFSGADFHAADLGESSLRDTRFAGCRFEKADLNKADLGGSCLSQSDLYRSRAVEARFINSDLRYADLSGANLMGATLERGDLRDASMRGANLFQADLARVHVNRKTDFDNALTGKMRTYPRKFPRDDEAQ